MARHLLHKGGEAPAGARTMHAPVFALLRKALPQRQPQYRAFMSIRHPTHALVLIAHKGELSIIG
jgi:hypothetical protein